MTILDVGVAIANKVTKSLKLQATVIYEREIGTDGYGTRTYGSAVPLRAIVDFTSKQVRTQDGVLTVTRATITLLDRPAIVAATNGDGVGNNDRFTLPDGDTGPILDIGGFVQEGGALIPTTVMIG